MTAPNLVLIGLRGSGKTSVGRLLGARTSRTFIDLDDRTPALVGAGYASVREAWTGAGEGAFREAESRALAHALAGRDQVIALGGGTPTAPGAAELLRAAAHAGWAEIVYLRAASAALRERLAGTDAAARPSLTGRGTLEEIEAVLAERDPLYRALAQRVIETEGLSVEDVAALLTPPQTAPPLRPSRRP